MTTFAVLRAATLTAIVSLAISGASSAKNVTISGKHGAGEIASKCGAVGGNFSLYGDGSYSCVNDKKGTVVSCDAKQKCSGWVPLRGQQGGVRAPTSGTISSGTTGGNTVKHPVHVGSGLTPIIATNGSSNGYKGGGMNQGGGHHRR